MVKSAGRILMRAAVIAVALAATSVAAQSPTILGTDAAACRDGASGPAALVTISGFKDRQGRLRLQYYTGLPGEYLESGKYLRRQEMPVTVAGDMRVCITLPSHGEFAMVALHDRDSDGKLSVWSDGIGFSNNPHLGLSKPAATKTVVSFGAGVTQVHIILNYLRGLSVRPIAK